MREVVRAHGQVLALIATILDREGLVSIAEFGNLIGLFATLRAEDDAEEGLIFASWALTVKEAARRSMEPPPSDRSLDQQASRSSQIALTMA